MLEIPEKGARIGARQSSGVRGSQDLRAVMSVGFSPEAAICRQRSPISLNQSNFLRSDNYVES
jgi:hypothetical protein